MLHHLSTKSAQAGIAWIKRRPMFDYPACT